MSCCDDHDGREAYEAAGHLYGSQRLSEDGRGSNGGDDRIARTNHRRDRHVHVTVDPMINR